jgi:hypothetical protein
MGTARGSPQTTQTQYVDTRPSSSLQILPSFLLSQLQLTIPNTTVLAYMRSKRTMDNGGICLMFLLRKSYNSSGVFSSIRKIGREEIELSQESSAWWNA